MNAAFLFPHLLRHPPEINGSEFEASPHATCAHDFRQALLSAGASLAGKTLLDEMAFSMEGQNVHYGTPANPAAPGRIAGGSSCGSAVGFAFQRRLPALVLALHMGLTHQTYRSRRAGARHRQLLLRLRLTSHHENLIRDQGGIEQRMH